ncbi:toll/interleukin-1 receptor domain-containing protein [Streptomyces sp. NPDC058657]|uniref:toll/interleukin-1 receptor domain-containing protein n=1 Tax=unclassified Streptomyces TaxID=2593676 RepID=UPI00364C0845
MAKHDLFISHASEDKDDLVRALVGELSSIGLKVWYDEFSLSVGDSLSASIDRGLSGAKYGVVILSPSFLKKPWPEYELRSLVALEAGKPKRIIPIWHNVTREAVLKYSPHLADKFALDSSGKPPMHLAFEITRATHPDKFKALVRRFAKMKERQEGSQLTPLTKLATWPALREPLTQTQLVRLRLVQETLMEVFPQNWNDMVADFQRDSKEGREEEILLWERIAGTYLNICRRFPLSNEERKLLFNQLLGMTLKEEALRGSSQPAWARAAAIDFEAPLGNAYE